MKTTILTLILVMNLSLLFGQDIWTQKADYGGCERAFGFSFVVNGKAYVGGGESYGCGIEYDNEIWEYNPVNDQWLQKNNLPINPYDLKAFSINNYGYIVVYYNNAGTWETQLWEYNPTSDEWTQKSNFPGDNRESGIGFSIENKGYYGLGGMAPTYKTDFWEYDPTLDQWTQLTDMPEGRRGATAFSINSKGYIGLGSGGLNDFWEYDPGTNSWTQKADFDGTARQYAVSFTIGDKGYIGTGYDGSYTNDFWEYNNITNTWEQIENMPGPVRQAAVAFTIDDKGYVTNGYDGSGWVVGYKDLWEYSTSTSIFETPNTINELFVYPNPIDETSVISVASNDIKKINVINCTGSIVATLNPEFDENGNCSVKIGSALENFPKGVYFVQVVGNKDLQSIKVIK
ncbi:MAG: hypothetical protein A2W91_19150 [Bacteroidetes bacterium GWF2_38_335]|nr:MAG: hypothetical protein A2W91_19150 [Bacteroidetes bacterium GWF2_38_335]HBS86332.1 hypothetical protein [Bacteroidales bacterium]